MSESEARDRLLEGFRSWCQRPGLCDMELLGVVERVKVMAEIHSATA
jgi:hypothetical protein